MPKWLQNLLTIKQCNYSWSTRPERNAVPGAHYEHTCVNAPEEGKDKCKGPHNCRNWECAESHP